MQTLKSSSIYSTFHLFNSSLKPIFKSSQFIILQYFSSASCPTVSNPPLFNYLVKNLNFNETQAVSISDRYRNVKYLEKAQSVVNFFQSLGFSNAQIVTTARLEPQILFTDVEKKLRPKIKYFQDLGLMEPHIGKFFSRNAKLLTYNLDKKLIPKIQLIKKVLGNNNEDLFKVFSGCSGSLVNDSTEKLSRNVEYLESCGIVGSQLSSLLMRQPRIFSRRESALRDLVSRALDMGFPNGSRLLVDAILTMHCLSRQTFKKKWELFKSYGFSDNDCGAMFRKTPCVFKVSEEKLKLGIEFFINVAKVDKDELVCRPIYLMFSLEDRVIPRYRVLQIINSMELLKEDLSLFHVLGLSELAFLELISKFTEDVEELLIAFKAGPLPSSSKEEEVEEEEEEDEDEDEDEDGV